VPKSALQLDAFYLPEDFAPPHPLERHETPLSGSLSLRQLHATPELVAALARHVKQAGREVLRAMPIQKIVQALDMAAEEWLERRAPDYDAVIDAMASVTGFSREMVCESVRIEQHSSRADDMWRALANEFGDPAVLDKFVWRPEAKGYARACGPDLTLALSPGNIPALSHLPFMRALLVKSPILCKPSASEPVYAAAYARSLARCLPELARCMAVIYWHGGDEALENAAFQEAGAVIAFGSAETCASISSRVPPGARLILHGHKLGFVVVDAAAVHAANRDDLAARLAYDAAMFDQQACLSPHWIFVIEKNGEEAAQLAAALTTALRAIETVLPRGAATIAESVRYCQAADDAELAAAMGEPTRLFSSRDGDRFLVLLDRRRPLRSSCLGRAITIVPVSGIEEIETLLSPFRGHFQNVAIEAAPPESMDIAERLAWLGATRVCRPGRMACPSMMWHHDGLPCLETMVRYCDWEGQDGAASQIS